MVRLTYVAVLSETWGTVRPRFLNRALFHPSDRQATSRFEMQRE